VASIDAVFLGTVWITFFHQLIFDTPRLAQFMRRTIKFKGLNEARVLFNKDNVLVDFFPLTQTSGTILMMIFSCSESDWQLSSPAQVCTSSSSTVCMVEHIYVDEDRFSKQYWHDDIHNTHWVELSQPITAMNLKNLYLSKKFLSCIATTPPFLFLSEDRVTGVLPTLESLFFWKSFGHQDLSRIPGSPCQLKVVAAGQLSAHPITVSQ
jgi:hypothetical protein